MSTTYDQKNDAEAAAFDPNHIDRLAFATYCPRRVPQFKEHIQRGHAIAAVKRHCGRIYELRSGRWELIGEILHSRPHDCEDCGHRSPSYYYGLKAMFVRGRDGRFQEPLESRWVCANCGYGPRYRA